MRSSLHGPDQFLRKSKKPHIQELVKRVPDMTEDEIRALPERTDTIKGLLILKRHGSESDRSSKAEKLADLMNVTFKPTEGILDHQCIVYQVNESIWVSTGNSEILVDEGNLIGLLPDGSAIIKAVYVKKCPIDVLQRSTLLKKSTVRELKRLDYDRVQKLCV
jgi:hypothetical protein